MSTSRAITIIVAVGILVYFTSLFNQFVLDDFELIVRNDIFHSLSNFPKFFVGGLFSKGGTEYLYGSNYRPIFATILAFIYSLAGAQPFMFHLFQVMLHISTTILLFLLFKSFLKPLNSLLISLIFLVHSAHSEAVFYTSAMSDILYVLFGIAALLLIIKGRTIKAHIGIALLLGLSFLSKESSIVFLVISPLMSWLFNQKAFPRILFSAGLVLFVCGFLRFKLAHILPLFAGGMSPIMQASFQERLYTFPALLLYYLEHIFFPINLVVGQHWVISQPTFTHFYQPLLLVSLFMGILLLFGLFLYKKNYTYYKIYLFFFFWFLLGLGVHSHIVHPLDVTVADRYLYFPFIGFLGMVGVAVSIIKVHNTVLKQIGITLAIIILMILSIKTIARSFDWRSNFDLVCHDITLSSNSFELENLCGVELMIKRRYSEAEPHLKKSVQLNPYGANINNLGLIYLVKGDSKQAIELFDEAANKYHYYKAYENLASALLVNANNPQKSKEVIRQGLQFYPSNVKLWYILALAEYKMGNKENALYSAKIYAQLKGTKNALNLYYLIQRDTPWEEII